MPYLLFLLGFILAIFTLYRFFVTASVPEMSAAIRKIMAAFFVFILLFFAMTGRIRVSILLVLITIPFIINHYRKKYKQSKRPPPVEEIIENESQENDD